MQVDVAPVLQHDLHAERQADARTTGFRGEKRDERLLLHLGRHARPAVGHADFHLPARLAAQGDASRGYSSAGNTQCSHNCRNITGGRKALGAARRSVALAGIRRRTRLRVIATDLGSVGALIRVGRPRLARLIRLAAFGTATRLLFAWLVAARLLRIGNVAARDLRILSTAPSIGVVNRTRACRVP